MKVAIFLFGAVVGVFSTASLLLAVEVVRAYRENTDSDPWNEYASEEKPQTKPFDWERWKSADEINQERRAKQEFYNREDDEL
jgi:hypothetical protein